MKYLKIIFLFDYQKNDVIDFKVLEGFLVFIIFEEIVFFVFVYLR